MQLPSNELPLTLPEQDAPSYVNDSVPPLTDALTGGSLSQFKVALQPFCVTTHWYGLLGHWLDSCQVPLTSVQLPDPPEPPPPLLVLHAARAPTHRATITPTTLLLMLPSRERPAKKPAHRGMLFRAQEDR